MCALRGVRIPAGEHALVFTYDRSDFDKGSYVLLATFGVALLRVVGGVVLGRVGKKKKQVS